MMLFSYVSVFNYVDGMTLVCYGRYMQTYTLGALTILPLLFVNKCNNIKQYFIIFLVLCLFVEPASISTALLLCANKFKHVISFTFSLIYALGYPLYCLLFGFSYFGASVSCVALLAFILIWAKTNDKHLLIIDVIVLFALSGLGLSYTLFVPEIFLATFIYYLVRFKNSGCIINKYNFIRVIRVFVFPSLLIIALSLSLVFAL